MTIENKESYTLVAFDYKNFNMFIKKFEDFISNSNKNNIVVHLLGNELVNKKDIFLFLPYILRYNDLNLSFIVVCSMIDIDDCPDEINIVPTIKEAEDVIEIENIQRDLNL